MTGMVKALMAIVLCTFFLAACSSKEKQKENVVNESTKNTLPPLPQTEYALLIEQCDFIDYIFHDLPFSLSQNEKESIQQNILFIDRAGVETIPRTCKPMARKFFKIKGNIVLEADVFMDNTCRHFVFYKNNKAVYANKMAQSGINFYNNLIEQAAKMGQSQGQ